jgi:hypothetical protein
MRNANDEHRDHIAGGGRWDHERGRWALLLPRLLLARKIQPGGEIMMKIPMCAQCGSAWDGEEWDDRSWHPEDADVLVRGRLGSGAPYRANLCEDHLAMLTDDGAELQIIKTYQEVRS